MDQIGGLLAAFALVIFAVGVFFFSLWLLYRLVAWFLGLPGAVTNKDLLPKFVAAFVALIFASPLIMYLTDVVDAGLRTLPGAIDSLFRAARAVALHCTVACSFEVVQSISGALASIVDALVSALQLEFFPVGSAVVFLFLYSILYFGYVVLLRQRIEGQTFAGGNAATSGSLRTMQIGFFAVVVSAFYLSLSALLALSLMQSATLPDGFRHTDLKSAIDAEIPSEVAFSAQFSKVASFVGNEIDDATLDGARRPVASGLRISANALAEDWATAARSTRRQLIDLQNRAVGSFNSESTQRLGGRPTIDHYDRLLAWFQRQRRAKEASLSVCLVSVNAWIRNASDLVANWRAAQRHVAAGEPSSRDDPYIIELELRSGLKNALAACDVSQNAEYEPLPGRPSRGESLGYVGRITGWLLDTDSRPLVIIIGLVGFSLLGAAVSRVVRLGADDGLAGLDIGDLMRVVAGGVTAAMLVFLAAYGGLAILGETETDPNPYVIFTFCLVGAIFSERVWIWAESVILARITGREQEDKGNQPESPSEDPQPSEGLQSDSHEDPGDVSGTPSAGASKSGSEPAEAEKEQAQTT